MEYNSPNAIKAFLEAEGLAMSKRFGQNFLIDERSRAKILDELGAPSGAHVWEIGPGLGAMTAMALDAGLRMTAFEIDHGFARILRRFFAADPNFHLVEGDFLKTWTAELGSAHDMAPEASAPRAHADGKSCGRPDAVFGNLPYNASNAIVAAMIEGPSLADFASKSEPLSDWSVPGRMVFTIQKECARRMAAAPGRKDYSAFSVLCASSCQVRIAFDLGASSFWPAPNVTSSVVVLEPKAEALSAEDRRGFSAFVRASFSSRRKKLRNSLKAFTLMGAPIPPGALCAALEGLGLGLELRAEALSPDELAAVYAAIKRLVLPF